MAQPPGEGSREAPRVVALASVLEHLSCAVCHGLLLDTRQLSVCGHRFCRLCLESALRAAAASSGSAGGPCPVCRAHVPSLRFGLPDPTLDGAIRALVGDVPAFRSRADASAERVALAWGASTDAATLRRAAAQPAFAAAAQPAPAAAAELARLRSERGQLRAALSASEGSRIRLEEELSFVGSFLHASAARVRDLEAAVASLRARAEAAEVACGAWQAAAALASSTHAPPTPPDGLHASPSDAHHARLAASCWPEPPRSRLPLQAGRTSGWETALRAHWRVAGAGCPLLPLLASLSRAASWPAVAALMAPGACDAQLAALAAEARLALSHLLLLPEQELAAASPAEVWAALPPHVQLRALGGGAGREEDGEEKPRPGTPIPAVPDDE